MGSSVYNRLAEEEVLCCTWYPCRLCGITAFLQVAGILGYRVLSPTAIIWG